MIENPLNSSIYPAFNVIIDKHSTRTS